LTARCREKANGQRRGEGPLKKAAFYQHRVEWTINLHERGREFKGERNKFYWK